MTDYGPRDIVTVEFDRVADAARFAKAAFGWARWRPSERVVKLVKSDARGDREAYLRCLYDRLAQLGLNDKCCIVSEPIGERRSTTSDSELSLRVGARDRRAPDRHHRPDRDCARARH